MEFDFDRSNDRAVFVSMLHFLIANMTKKGTFDWQKIMFTSSNAAFAGLWSLHRHEVCNKCLTNMSTQFSPEKTCLNITPTQLFKATTVFSSVICFNECGSHSFVANLHARLFDKGRNIPFRKCIIHLKQNPEMCTAVFWSFLSLFPFLHIESPPP